VDASMLDMISLKSVTRIIKYYWDKGFSKYFRNESYNNWSEKLNLCALARNPLAHGQEGYLTESQRRLVDVYCAEIIEVVNSFLTG